MPASVQRMIVGIGEVGANQRAIERRECRRRGAVSRPATDTIRREYGL